MTAEEQYTKAESKEELIESMIEFAKYHLQKAIIEITMKAKMDVFPYDQEQWDFVDPIIQVSELDMEDGEIQINLDSIVNAYSLDNIK